MQLRPTRTDRRSFRKQFALVPVSLVLQRRCLVLNSAEHRAATGPTSFPSAQSRLSIPSARPGPVPHREAGNPMHRFVARPRVYVTPTTSFPNTALLGEQWSTCEVQHRLEILKHNIATLYPLGLAAVDGSKMMPVHAQQDHRVFNSE